MLVNPKALYHDYVPKKLPYREGQYNALSGYFRVLMEGLVPSHLLLLGPTGSGKTVTVRKVIEDFGDIKDMVIYTICHGTSYTTLVDIAEKVTGRRLWGYSFSKVWSVFEEKTRDRALMVVLDEVDKIVLPGKGDELLYYLSRRPLTTIIAVSNRMDVYNYIRDPRVKSSFTPRTVFFPPYSADELEGIVKLRVEEAFEPNVVDEGVVKYIAALATRRGGDARYAIDLLRFSAEVAVKEGSRKITIEHVRKAREEVEMDYITKGIMVLNEPQKLILRIVAEFGTLTISELVQKYNKIALEPLTQRRISDHISQLELLGYLKITRKGRGKGRGVSWYVSLAPGIEPQLVRKALTKTL